MTKKTSEFSMANKGPMYIYATEMINEYYSLFDLKNKNILTICGSGDQVLNALFLDAKKVTCFDLNIYSKYILNLKIASILILELKEFINYYGNNKINQGFDYKIYTKIREVLDNTTKSFFDNLYKEFNFDGKKVANSEYFRKRAKVQERSTKEFNLYLKNEESYKYLRKILKEKTFNFILESVLDISSKIKDQKYDLINLSNVQNYVCLNLSEENTVKCFNNRVLSPLGEILKAKGIMFYYTRDESCYPNSARKEPPTLTKQKNIKLLSKLSKLKISQKIFKGFKKGSKDKIVIFQKE